MVGLRSARSLPVLARAVPALHGARVPANDTWGAGEIDPRMVEFTPTTSTDLPGIKEIYDHYILSTIATLHESLVPVEKVPEYVPVDDPRHPSLVIRSGGVVVGFCSCSPYKRRSAYVRTAELSVYLRPGCTGRGARNGRPDAA